MRVGHGVARLEVCAGESMGGYADRTGGVAGELDPLEVHAVSWHAHGRRFLVLVGDLICVNTDLAGEIRRRLGDGCWVAATHTHAGPETGCLPGGGTTPAELGERVVAAAELAAAAARADEAPADGAVGRAWAADLAGVRSLPAARGAGALPLDVLAVSRGGQVVGLLVVLPVHPTVLPAGNLAVSADLPGALRRALAGALPGRPWVVVVTGAAGDVSTRHTRLARTPEEVDRLGGIAAGAVLDSLASAVPAWAEEDTIGGPVTAAVSLAAKAPGEVVLPDAGEGAGRTGYVRRQGAELARAMLDAGRTAPYPVEVEAVRVGALRMVGIPAEPYLSVGEGIVAGADGPAMVFGYTNGYLGYLPDREAYREPDYEVLASPVGSGGAEAVTRAALGLLSGEELG